MEDGGRRTEEASLETTLADLGPDCAVLGVYPFKPACARLDQTRPDGRLENGAVAGSGR